MFLESYAQNRYVQLGYNLGDKVTVDINKKMVSVPYVRTFMDAPVGDSLLYIDSRGRLGLAVNQASFVATYGVKPPVAIFIPRAKN